MKMLSDLFRPPVPEVTAHISDAAASSQHLTGWAYPGGLTRDRKGAVRGLLVLGRDEFGLEVTYTATEPKALVKLVKSAWHLYVLMMRARLKGRHAMWGDRS